MPKLTLPNFVIIGGSKSATHWLNVCLAPHPEIHITPDAAEVFFFDRYFQRGIDWYAHYFRGHGGAKRIGEVTSTYLAHPRACDRLHRTIPDALLVVSVRNPIDRAYSRYLHAWRRGEIPASLSFRQACDAVPEILIDGQYGRHIYRWMQLFDERQVKIKLMDDIATDPLAYVQDVYEWLGVDPNFEPYQATRGAVNIHQTPRSLSLARAALRLSEFLHARRFHGVVDLAKRFGVRKILFSQRRNGSKEPPPLSTDDRSWLQDYYLSDVELLSSIVERSLLRLWFGRQGKDVVRGGGVALPPPKMQPVHVVEHRSDEPGSDGEAPVP